MLYSFWKKGRYADEEAKARARKFDMNAFLEKNVEGFSSWDDSEKADIAYLINYYGEDSDNVRMMLDAILNPEARTFIASASKALRAGKSPGKELRWFHEEEKKKLSSKRGCYSSKPDGWPDITVNPESKNIAFEIVILATKLKKGGVKIRGVALDAFETPLGSVSIPVLAVHDGKDVPVFLNISPYQGLGFGTVRTVLALRSSKEYKDARVAMYSAYPIPPMARYILEDTPESLFECYVARRIAKLKFHDDGARENAGKIVIEGITEYFEEHSNAFEDANLDNRLSALEKFICKLRRCEEGTIVNLDTTMNAVGCLLGEMLCERDGSKWILKEGTEGNSVSDYFIEGKDGKKCDPILLAKERFAGRNFTF